MNTLSKRPTWELKNIVKALSFHPWLNTIEDTKRLGDAKTELKVRKFSRAVVDTSK
jgi:hypothetical protein